MRAAALTASAAYIRQGGCPSQWRARVWLPVVTRREPGAQAVAGRARRPAGTGTIRLNLSSVVDGEARSAERTMAGRGGCRARAGGRECGSGAGVAAAEAAGDAART